MSNEIKFGIYTSFYNCENYVDRIFSNIENLNYDNFEWHITDDYSSDNTKYVILNRLSVSNKKNKIKFLNQSEKKEMYWKPNIFFDSTFDWIVLMDSDDEFDPDFLNLYNKFINEDEDLSIVSCDFHKIKENEKSLHSVSYIINDDFLSKKINRYHPQVDYLKNVSYSCFGVLRAFKKSIITEFIIEDMMACAEDSYRIFWCNSFGKYLHIPRPMYLWYLRENSESHSKIVNENFNGNFQISLSRLTSNDFGVDKKFNDLYLETCALGSYDIGYLKNKKVSLWTRNLSESQQNLLKNLYLDSNLVFCDINSEVHIFVLNFLSKNFLIDKLKEVKNNKILLYFQNQNFYENIDDMLDETKNNLFKISGEIGEFFRHSWWLYFRHFVIKT